MVKNSIHQLITAPKRLFLVDSLGAALTAFLLFIILKNFNQYIGMPEHVLIFLAALAVCFCLYSATCFFLLKGNWQPFIRIIAGANILYCILTLIFLMTYAPLLTTIGMGYFLMEIAIVCGLVYIELTIAKRIDSNKQ